MPADCEIVYSCKSLGPINIDLCNFEGAGTYAYFDPIIGVYHFTSTDKK